MEMNDEEPDRVTGAAAGDILEVAPPKAFAEGLDIGTEIISEPPCFECFTNSYNYRLRVTGFIAGGLRASRPTASSFFILISRFA